jgi:protein transport protein SEC24
MRPELRCGTVEFVASKEFCDRTPAAAPFFFLIDVSWQAVQSGMLQICVDTIKEMLDFFPSEDGEPTKCKIAIATFDKTIHFYNLSVGLFNQVVLNISPHYSSRK